MDLFDRFSWSSQQSVSPAAPPGGPGGQLPHIIYCSSSTGNDANDGLSSTTAKATFAAAKALMRAGLEDQLLLLWGDVFNEVPGNWTTGGRSQLRRQKIGTYGPSVSGARPRFLHGTSDGLTLSAPLAYLTIENVWFTADLYTGAAGTPSGIKLGETSNYVTIQGCKFSNLAHGIRSDPPVLAGHYVRYLTVYRNNFEDIYAAVGNPCTGVYCARTENSSILDNVFSKIGEVDPGTQHYAVYCRSGLSYNCRFMRIDDNQILEVAGEAILNRSDRFNSWRNNISRAAIGYGLRGLDPTNGSTQEGIFDSYVQENCITEGRDTNLINARGWGFVFEHCGSPFFPIGIKWHNNLIANSGTATDPHPFYMQPNYPPPTGSLLREVDANGTRVYEWQGSCKINEVVPIPWNRTHSFDNAKVYSTGSHYVFEHNLANGLCINVGDSRMLSGAASGSRYRYNGVDENQATWRTHIGGGAPGTTELVGPSDFPDATRSIATYSTVCGGAGTFASFVTLVRTQTLQNWREELGGAATALWIRQGFGF